MSLFQLTVASVVGVFFMVSFKIQIKITFVRFECHNFSKGALLICGIMFAIGAILFYFCNILSLVELLLIGRFIVGLSSGVTTAVLGMYLAEIPPSQLRGTLATFSGLGSSTHCLIFIFIKNIFASHISNPIQ